MVIDCNIFKWCIEDVADEREQLLSDKRILEKRLKVSTRRIKMLLVEMFFLFQINIIMFLILA